MSMGAAMTYYNDGRTNTAFDLNDTRFDRKYEFDFAARLKEAYSGVEAHGASAPPLNQANSPYRQTYTYDEWNNVTQRVGRIWSAQSESDGASYGSNNKRSGFGYDAAGNVASANGDGTRTYDAAGRPVTFISEQEWQVYPSWPSGHPNAPALETSDTFDGTGQVVKHVHHLRHDDSTSDLGGSNVVYNMSETTTITYLLSSTVLGGKTIFELDQNGVKTKGYVYSGSGRIATQTIASGSQSVQIESTNPVTGASFTTDVNGIGVVQVEPDPLGRDLISAPDPTVTVDPLSISKWNEPMPIEYTGGPSAEYLNSNIERAALMDSVSVQLALHNNFNATARWILHKNPNVGIKTETGRTLYGEDADSYAQDNQTNELLSRDVITNDSILLGWPQNPALSLADAIAAAKNALKDPNGDCAKLFSKGNGLDLLNKGNIKVKDTSVPKNLSPTGKLAGNPLVGAVTNGNTIYINPSARTTLGTHAPISSGVYKDPSGLFNGFSPVDVLAAIIIHEELHKSGDFETETGGTAVSESIANSSLVINTCFKKSGP